MVATKNKTMEHKRNPQNAFSGVASRKSEEVLELTCFLKETVNTRRPPQVKNAARKELNGNVPTRPAYAKIIPATDRRYIIKKSMILTLFVVSF
jgi:hypothetical protein